MQTSSPPALPAQEAAGLAPPSPRPPDAHARPQTAGTDSAPSVWVLTDDKLGHSTQSEGIADVLGWPYDVKALQFNALNRISNGLLGASLVSLNRSRSAPLRPPWPDLVISTGRRTVPVARWIRAQSGGRTRLVQLGRKGADRADAFDLSVTCVHFGLPPHPRRIETLAPLTAISDHRLRASGERWRDLFVGLPRPHVALLVGGSSAMHLLDERSAARMAREVVAFARAAGGSVYIVTSPRTGAAACTAMRAEIGNADRLYEWKPGDPDNPYLGCLALADVLIATGDSESMLAETAATGTPLYIYDLPARPGNLRQQFRAWVGGQAAHTTVVGTVCQSLLTAGLVRAPRDLGAMHRALVDAGHAQMFGAPLRTTRQPPLRELDHVAERIRAMMAEAPKEQR